jgi:hypothetical protein
MADDRVCAVMLCYRDAEWVLEQVERWSAFVDVFAIAVGPYEGAADMTPDVESVARLEASEHSASMIVASGVWAGGEPAELRDLMEGEALAAAGYPPKVVELGPDELWPDELMLGVATVLRNAPACEPLHVVVPQRLYGGVGSRPLLELRSAADVGRASLPPLVRAGVAPVGRRWHHDVGLRRHGRLRTVRVTGPPLRHLAWVGERRVRRKLAQRARAFPTRRHAPVEDVLALLRGERGWARVAGVGLWQSPACGVEPDVVEFARRMMREG